MPMRTLSEISPNVSFKIAQGEKTEVPEGAVLLYHADVKGKKICTWSVSDTEIKTFLLNPKTRVELLCHQAVIKDGRLDDFLYYLDETGEQWYILLGLNGLTDITEIYEKGLRPIKDFTQEEKLAFLNKHLQEEIKSGCWEWEYLLKRDAEFRDFLANLSELSLLHEEELESVRFTTEA